MYNKLYVLFSMIFNCIVTKLKNYYNDIVEVVIVSKATELKHNTFIMFYITTFSSVIIPRLCTFYVF